jgi:hypothetical protein
MAWCIFSGLDEVKKQTTNLNYNIARKIDHVKEALSQTFLG